MAIFTNEYYLRISQVISLVFVGEKEQKSLNNIFPVELLFFGELVDFFSP